MNQWYVSGCDVTLVDKRSHADPESVEQNNKITVESLFGWGSLSKDIYLHVIFVSPS